jgi:hypothetical protein
MSKTRIQIALSEYEYDVVKRLALATGTPISKALHGQIEAVIPVLEKVVSALEAAQRTAGEGRAKLLAQALKLHGEMDAVAAHALDQFDMFSAAAASGASALGASVATAQPEPHQARTGSTGRRSQARTKATPKPPVSHQGKRKHGRRGK